MSLSQLLDEVFDPREMWSQRYARRCNNVLSSAIANPKVDLYPVEGGMELKADLPGLAKEDVGVVVENNTVTLSGERKSAVERDEDGWHYAERQFGTFTRRLRLPFNADPSTVSASFENGVLSVSIPQPAHTMPGKIEIN